MKKLFRVELTQFIPTKYRYPYPFLHLPISESTLVKQEFKNALKEDTVDYSVYTSNIKRKRPPGRPRIAKAAVGHVNGGRNNRDEDDDDDDDETWGSGTRVAASGGRRNTRSQHQQQRL